MLHVYDTFTRKNAQAYYILVSSAQLLFNCH